MSNIFGVYEANLVGLVSTDDQGNIEELASLNETGEVESVAVLNDAGEIESVWENNLFGGSNEYTVEGELISYSVPDENIDGVEHIFDEDDNLVALSVDDSVDFVTEDSLEGGSFLEETFDSISLEDFV